MPRQITLVTLFLASPSDVAAERASLDLAIDHLNIQLQPLLDLRVQVLKWETDTHPAAGSDAQQIINSQIPEDIDIFVGVFWARIGTATPRAISGTVEELERALQRYTANPSNVRVMVYFKNEPVPMDRLDPNQIAGVQSLKAKLRDAGVLYREFMSTRDFEQLVKLHLTTVLSSISKDRKRSESENDPAPPGSNHTPVLTGDNDEAEELGFLDYEEIAIDSMNQFVAVIGQMSGLMTQLGEKTVAAATELNNTQDNSAKKKIINNVGASMEVYAAQFRELLVEFKSQQRKSIDATIQRFTLTLGDGSQSEQENTAPDFTVLQRDIEMMVSNYSEALTHTEKLRDTIHAVPRATAGMNRAKRAVVSVLDEYLAEGKAGILLWRYASGEGHLPGEEVA